MIEKDLSGSLRASHAFAYDAASNRTSAFSAQAGATAKAMTAAHNNMNQITTLGGGGKTRVAGSLDEPGQVSVGIVGQGDKPARMLSGNRFETELDLPAGTSTLQITAADGSANLTTKQYSVVISPETSRTVTHDADGNLTSDGVRSYEWDTWSRLKKITWATGKSTTFHYNALGERTKIVHVDGGTTRTEYYLYDGPRPIQRRSGGNAASNIDREYFSGGERRWNISSSSWSNHHYCRDHLGSVREVLDSSGTLLARYDYAPYGERETRYEASGYSSDVGFTGHFLLPSPVSGQSEILLAHYRAYDPVLGRWLSQDPIREEGGINLYGYVGGSVILFRDPLGLQEMYFSGNMWLYRPTPGAFITTNPNHSLKLEEVALQFIGRDYRQSSWQGGPMWHGKWKCNLLVADVIVAKGYPAPLVPPIDRKTHKVSWWRGKRIATAAEWADGTVNIPGFSAPHNNPKPGDVVTNGKHMGILTEGGIVQAPLGEPVYSAGKEKFWADTARTPIDRLTPAPNASESCP